MISILEPGQLMPHMSIEDELDNIGLSFHDKLSELINQSKIDNKNVVRGHSPYYKGRTSDLVKVKFQLLFVLPF